jgi:hypothetical protein
MLSDIDICRHCGNKVPEDEWHCLCNIATQEWNKGLQEIRINAWEREATRMFITVNRRGEETVWHETDRLEAYIKGPFMEIVKFLRPGQQIIIKAIERKDNQQPGEGETCPRCKGTGRVKNHFGPLPWDDCPDCAGKEKESNE